MSKRQRTKTGVIRASTGEALQPRKPTTQELGYLLRDLAPYAKEMPVELWDRLRNFIAGEIVRGGVPMADIHRIRWKVVREEMDRVNWEDSFASASAKLAGSPADGGERAMQESYELIERTLPPEQRRPHTHRKRGITTTR